MKKLQTNFTTPEQSKRLLELGVPADSADCYYLDLGLDDYAKVPKFGNGDYQNGDIPCWSVGRLIELIKLCSTDRFYIPYRIIIFDWEEETLIEDIVSEMKTRKWCLDFSKLEE